MVQRIDVLALGGESKTVNIIHIYKLSIRLFHIENINI